MGKLLPLLNRVLLADAGFLGEVAGLAGGGFGGEADDCGGDGVAAGEGGGFCEAGGGSGHGCVVGLEGGGG